MSVPPNKKRLALSVTQDTIDSLDRLTRDFKLSSKSDFISALVNILEISDCKNILKDLTQRGFLKRTK